MIAVLNDAGDSITIELAAAVASVQPKWGLIWKGEGGPANPVGATNGITPVNMLVGVTGKPREVESLSVYNEDTAAVDVIIKMVVDGTGYVKVNATIPVAGTLSWSKETGPVILNSLGSTPSDAVGAVVAGIGVVAVESGSGNFRRTVLTLTNTPLTITNALAYAGLKLHDMPAGRIKFLDCVTSLAFTTTSALAGTLNAEATVSYGIGSATASATTLATTMMDLMPGSGEAVKEFTSSETINVPSDVVTGFLAAVAAAQLGAILDGTTTPVDIFLNVALADADEIDGDATLVVNGTITLTWVNGGDT